MLFSCRHQVLNLHELDLETTKLLTILCLPSNLTWNHEQPPSYPNALSHILAGLSGDVFGLGYAVPSVVDQRTPSSLRSTNKEWQKKWNNSIHHFVRFFFKHDFFVLHCSPCSLRWFLVSATSHCCFGWKSQVAEWRCASYCGRIAATKWRCWLIKFGTFLKWCLPDQILMLRWAHTHEPESRVSRHVLQKGNWEDDSIKWRGIVRCLAFNHQTNLLDKFQLFLIGTINRIPTV